MKILRVIARLNVGGPARHVTWLASGLKREGFETRLMAGRVPAGEEDMSYFAELHGVSPLYIEQMSRELSPGDLVATWKLYGEMRRFGPDVIHTHTAKAGTVGRVAAFLYRWLTPGTLIGRPRPLKIVHTFHGHIFHSYYGPVKTRSFLFIERALARLATDKIVAITEQQREEINGSFKVGRPQQFEVIPLGIDLSAFNGGESAASDQIRFDSNASNGEFLAVFVGRLTEIKNIPMLLKCASEIRMEPEARPKVVFGIVGDGNLKTQLEQESKDLGVSEIVTFLGNRQDISAIYAAADAVVLTSLNEGTPLSLIEAMAAGVPVISAKVGGVTDLLGEIADETDEYTIHERGIGVASNDAGGLASGLRRLSADPELRSKISNAAKAFVNEKYSKERLVSDIKELYERLLSVR